MVQLNKTTFINNGLRMTGDNFICCKTFRLTRKSNTGFYDNEIIYKRSEVVKAKVESNTFVKISESNQKS